MPHLLVTGPSGCGKSYFARVLGERGYATFDSDAIPGLAAWHDSHGGSVPTPASLDMDFVTTHRLLWDKRVLRAWLSAHPVAVLFGISHNSAEQTALFDLAALIEAPLEEILRNLVDERRANAFGHPIDHVKMARPDTADYYQRAPGEWLRLPERDPDELIAHLQRATGNSLRLPSART